MPVERASDLRGPALRPDGRPHGPARRAEAEEGQEETPPHPAVATPAPAARKRGTSTPLSPVKRRAVQYGFTKTIKTKK